MKKLSLIHLMSDTVRCCEFYFLFNFILILFAVLTFSGFNILLFLRLYILNEELCDQLCCFKHI